MADENLNSHSSDEEPIDTQEVEELSDDAIDQVSGGLNFANTANAKFLKIDAINEASKVVKLAPDGFTNFYK